MCIDPEFGRASTHIFLNRKTNVKGQKDPERYEDDYLNCKYDAESAQAGAALGIQSGKSKGGCTQIDVEASAKKGLGVKTGFGKKQPSKIYDDEPKKIMMKSRKREMIRTVAMGAIDAALAITDWEE